ncbi:MAG TPA: MOSC N-terminal beta barrel domain-containing protein [Kofleriaceae bacterium]|nr:MOSC N-terminal beta barrel domain-containing protein [Kofleriaceae bacterium]
MPRVGQIAQLWRFPVKSMAGERLERAEVGELGVVGDRLWAVRDEERGHITGGKRLPSLMACSARFLAEPTADAVDDRVPPVAITLPDGAELVSDQPDASARLSAFLGRRVTLCPRRPADQRAHYRGPRATAADMRLQFGLGPDDPMPDFSMFPTAMLVELARYATPPGTYLDAYALHVLTSASLAELGRLAPAADIAPLRFRPNLLVDSEETGFVENGWCGGALRAGDLVGRVEIPTVRCSMVTREQPGLGADPSVLKALVDHTRRCAGVYARVEQAGAVRVGDAVELEPATPTRVGGWMRSGARSLRRLALRATAAVLPEE